MQERCWAWHRWVNSPMSLTHSFLHFVQFILAPPALCDHQAAVSVTVVIRNSLTRTKRMLIALVHRLLALAVSHTHTHTHTHTYQKYHMNIALLIYFFSSGKDTRYCSQKSHYVTAGTVVESGFDSWHGIFSSSWQYPDWLWGHPSLVSSDQWGLPVLGWSGWGIELIEHPTPSRAKK